MLKLMERKSGNLETKEPYYFESSYIICGDFNVLMVDD